MELIFVRHGQTSLNKKGVYQGKIDAPLNETGIKEAKEVREKLKGVRFHKAYSSPLIRATTTCSTIVGENNFYRDSRIEEIDFGKWDNIPYNQVHIGYEKEYQEFLNDYESFTFPFGESFSEFYNRCVSFLEDIIDVNSSETILVVAHGGVIRVFLCYLLGLTKSKFYSFSVKQGCYSKVIVCDGINLIDEINK